MSFPFPIFAAAETCVAITETIKPNATVQDSGWAKTEASMHLTLDELSNDDEIATLDVSGLLDVCAETGPFKDFDVRLEDPSTPGAGSCQGMEIQWRGADETNLPVGGCINWKIELRQATTLVKQQLYSDLGISPTTRTFSLSIAQVDAITDHTDLRIRVFAQSGLEDLSAKSGPEAYVFYVGVNYFAR